MTHPNCPTEPLERAIFASLPEQEQLALEEHLDRCLYCRKQIEQIVAQDEYWDRAAKILADSVSMEAPIASETPTISVRVGSSAGSTSGESATGAALAAAEPLLLDPPSHPEMLGRIDGFDIEQLIGRGGMGIVYKGFDTELNRPVAIKILAPHLAANGVARRRFAREAQAAAAVVHPNVVPIHSVNGSDRPYLVMTLVDGRSLQAEVEQNGPMPVRDVVRIGQQIAAGLSAAHSQGLVHRDIKPANILLEKDVSRVMITDFGLARAADDAAITQTGWLAGTPHYMSPEQAMGGDVDFPSDLFSLGSVLYFLATGREPFRAEKPFAVLQKINHDRPVSPMAINSEVPKTLDRIILRLLEKDPANRFESAEEVCNVLKQYLAHLQHPQSQPKPRIRQLRNSRRRRIVMLAGVCLALFIAGSLAWINYQPSKPDLLEGIDPIDTWQNKINQLDYEIRQLERSPTEQSNFIPTDEFEQQKQEFLRQLQSIEANLDVGN